MNKNNLLNYPLNGEEMQFLNPDSKIISYTELNNIKNLEELFKDTDKIIILYLLFSSTAGHWVCLFKNHKYQTLNFFSSYGVPEDYELDNISKEKRNELNVKSNRLSFLTKDYLIYYNNIILQGLNTTTCGCFVSHRLYYSELNEYEYLNIFLKNNVYSPDLFVSKWCYNRLLKK